MEHVMPWRIFFLAARTWKLSWSVIYLLFFFLFCFKVKSVEIVFYARTLRPESKRTSRFDRQLSEIRVKNLDQREKDKSDIFSGLNNEFFFTREK